MWDYEDVYRDLVVEVGVTRSLYPILQ
jgi:hypothetical protein